MTIPSLIAFGILVACAAFTWWLGARLLMSQDQASGAAIASPPDRTWRIGFAALLFVVGLVLMAFTLRRFDLNSAAERPSGILVDPEVQTALETVATRRFVDTASHAVLEGWLNAYVRAAPRFSKQRIVSGETEAPEQIVRDIKDGKPLTDAQRIHLLEWLVLEVKLTGSLSDKDLVRMISSGDPLDEQERSLLATWLSGVPEVPLPHHPDNLWPGYEAAPAAPAAPTVADPPAAEPAPAPAAAQRDQLFIDPQIIR